MNKIKNTFKFKLDMSDGEADEEFEPVSPKELTDEIMDIKRQQHAFNATNDHQNYLVVVFSCKEDLQEFQANSKLEGNTFIDGYELARKMNVAPKKPSLKLPVSLDEKFKNRH
jgi:hypothetical protein